MPEIKSLNEMMHELTRYHTMPCGLLHEKVNSYTPADHHLQTEAVYSRNGFCSKETRRWRLGCAHTMANQHYRKLLQELITCGVLDLPDEFFAEIDQIVLSICLMDHQKGDMEKQFVEAAIKHDELKSSHLAEQKKMIAIQHAEKIARLETLRLTVLKKMELIDIS